MRAKNIYIDGVDVTEAVTSTADNAEAAATSATNASNSAVAADNTATALTNIYNDAIAHGTVVAPAIDTTFAISGAAADAKIVGDSIHALGVATIDGAGGTYVSRDFPEIILTPGKYRLWVANWDVPSGLSPIAGVLKIEMVFSDNTTRALVNIG